MRRSILLPFLLLSLSTAALAASPAGTYTGKWFGASAEGAFNLALSQGKKGEWTAEVSFTYGDSDIKCKMVSVKVEETKIELVYDFQIAGMQARSTVTGEINGGSMSGKYHTKAPDGTDVDEGTWKVALTK
jgi:hypothetical protein